MPRRNLILKWHVSSMYGGKASQPCCFKNCCSIKFHLYLLIKSLIIHCSVEGYGDHALGIVRHASVDGYGSASTNPYLGLDAFAGSLNQTLELRIWMNEGNRSIRKFFPTR